MHPATPFPLPSRLRARFFSGYGYVPRALPLLPLFTQDRRKTDARLGRERRCVTVESAASIDRSGRKSDAVEGERVGRRDERQT